MRFSSKLALLSAVTSVLADCSSLGPGASNAVSGTFDLAAFNAVTGVTSALHVLNAVTIPETTYHIVGVSTVPRHVSLLSLYPLL